MAGVTERKVAATPAGPAAPAAPTSVGTAPSSLQATTVADVKDAMASGLALTALSQHHFTEIRTDHRAFAIECLERQLVDRLIFEKLEWTTEDDERCLVCRTVEKDVYTFAFRNRYHSGEEMNFWCEDCWPKALLAFATAVSNSDSDTDDDEDGKKEPRLRAAPSSSDSTGAPAGASSMSAEMSESHGSAAGALNTHSRQMDWDAVSDSTSRLSVDD